jgi:hypothetical protein
MKGRVTHGSVWEEDAIDYDQVSLFKLQVWFQQIQVSEL